MFDTPHLLETVAYPAFPDSRHDRNEDTLLRKFRQRYDTLIADTAERIRLAQKIRYQVYCIEKTFLSVDNLHCVEADEFDSHSAHTLLISRETGAALGTHGWVLPTAPPSDGTVA